MTAQTHKNRSIVIPQASQKPQGFTLRHKIITGFGGLLLLLTLSIVFTLYKLSTIEESAISVIEHRQPATVIFISFSKDLNLAISLLNEYLLTALEEDIARYQLVTNRLLSYLDDLDSLASSNDNYITAESMIQLEELVSRFMVHGTHLILLRDDNYNNYPGLKLASDKINIPVLEFIGLVNNILANDDIDASPEITKAARNHIFDLRYTMSQMMSSLRLYFNLGTKRDIDNFNIYADINLKTLDKLKGLDINIGFDALTTLTTKYNAILKNIPAIVKLRSSSAWRADINMMKTEVKPVVDELRSLVKKLVSKQIIESKKSGAALTSSLEEIRLYTVSLLAFALSIGLLLSAMITRGIVPPIRELMEAAKYVASGDLNAEVNVKSRDEIGMLGGSFNAMVDSLRVAEIEKTQSLENLEKLNSELEERVANRTIDLKRSEARIRAIFENVGEGIVVIDENGHIDSVNPAARKIFALQNENVIGLHAVFLLADRHYAQFTNVDHYVDDVDGPFSSTDSRHPVEIEGKRMDGSLFPMEMVVTGMKLGIKNMRTCIVRDITKRRLTELRLKEAQESIVNAAHKSGMAEIATGVLHNIGNILNSVNISVEEVSRIARSSKVSGLSKANALLSENIDNISEFFSNDDKGKKLPEYYLKLGTIIENEFSQIIDESKSLCEKTTMMKEVISTQQAYATAGSFTEDFQLATLIDDALKVQEASLNKWGVVITKDYDKALNVAAQKSKLLQVITNLIKNAQEATSENDTYNKEKTIKIITGLYKDKYAYVSVYDNGCGIDKNNISNIFSHGYTTKENGHGFGLHTSANSMTEMGGTLTVSSKGLQNGSCFTVSIPLTEGSIVTDITDNTAADRIALAES